MKAKEINLDVMTVWTPGTGSDTQNQTEEWIFWNVSEHKRNLEGDQGVLGPPRRSQICHLKVPNMTSEGPKLYLRSNNGFKKEENA